MKKRFYHILLSIFFALMSLAVIYLVFASIEGKKINDKNFLFLPTKENKVSQKLLAGDYAVFSTVTKIGENYEFGLWRYLVGIDGLVKFYSLKINQLEQLPVASKFSAESVSVHLNDQHTLVHINGDVIGPAENNQALISPDRNWLAYTEFSTSGPATIYLKSIIDNQSIVVLTSGTDNINPNQDNFKVLAWSDDSKVLYVQNNKKIYKFFPQILDITEITNLTNLNADKFFLQPQADIIMAIVDSNGVSSLYLVNAKTDESLFVLSNTAADIINAYYDQTTNKIIYNLDSSDPQVWQVDISHPQVVSQNFLHSGKLLSWPEDDKFIIQKNQDIYLYSKKENSTQLIFSASSTTDLVKIYFLDMFKIN